MPLPEDLLALFRGRTGRFDPRRTGGDRQRVIPTIAADRISSRG